jgi:integrase
VWVATIELPRDPATGRRVRRKASAPTKTAARDLLDDMRTEKKRAGTVGRGNLTVDQVVADYLAHPPATWRSRSTVEVNHGHAARITAALGTVKLAKLTPSRVERFLADMVAEGYSTSTIGATRRLLRAVIRRAQRDGLIGRNVADLADAPSGTVKPGRSFTVREMEGLLAAAADDPWWHAYCHVAIMVGLRPGELLGLQWADVDLIAPTVIRVRHSLKADGLADLKTEKSRRSLALPAAVTASLRAHKRQQAAERIRLGGAWHEHGLVFPGADGESCSRRRAEHGFAKLCERAGLGAGWTRYACRHTFATRLSHGGVDIEVIADAMGHAISNVTRTVYRHALLRLPGGQSEDDVVASAAARGLAIEGLASYHAGGARRGPALVIGYGRPADHAFTTALARLGAVLAGLAGPAAPAGREALAGPEAGARAPVRRP